MSAVEETHQASEIERNAAAIAAQNDRFRGSLGNTPDLPGQLIMTIGVVARGERFQAEAIRTVATYDSFDDDNDPHGERDFGAFRIGEQKLFWKIDLFAPDLEHGPEEPANPDVTVRILTLMLAEEY